MPGGPNKATRDRVMIANLVISASAQPSSPEQTLTYSDLAAVEQALAQTASAWAPPSPDHSIPNAAAERRAWAGRINAAIKNTEGDIQGKPYRLWDKNSDIDSTLSAEAFEYISYKIINIAERLHTQDPLSLHIFKPEMLKDIKNKTRIWTFEQRMEHVIKLVCFWKSRCEAFLVGNGIVECVVMPLQKMIDALQMGPENKRRQDRLEKGKVRETAEANTGVSRQRRRVAFSADATSTAATVATGRNVQLAHEASTGVGDQEIDSPAPVPTTSRECDSTTASGAGIEDASPRAMIVVYSSSDDDAKYPIDQLLESDEEATALDGASTRKACKRSSGQPQFVGPASKRFQPSLKS